LRGRTELPPFKGGIEGVISVRFAKFGSTEYINYGSIWIPRRFTYSGDVTSFHHYMLSILSILATRFSSATDALYD
jgi:hypothetical protein